MSLALHINLIDFYYLHNLLSFYNNSFTFFKNTFAAEENNVDFFQTIFHLDSSFGLKGLKIKFEFEVIFTNLSKVIAYPTPEFTIKPAFLYYAFQA